MRVELSITPDVANHFLVVVAVVVVMYLYLAYMDSAR